MNKNWLYFTLTLLVVAWLAQLYWQDEDLTRESDAVTDNKVERPVSPSLDKSLAPARKEQRKVTPPQVVETVKTPTLEPEKSAEQQYDQQAVIDQLLQSRQLNYARISGYPAIAEIIYEEECGNLIDTDIERATIDVNRLSGNGIFVSEYFCMASAIWQKLGRVLGISKQRTKPQLDKLQQAYRNLIGSISDKTEQVVVTRLFVNMMANFYLVFPAQERTGNEHFQLAVLIQSPLKIGKEHYLTRARFNLLNRLDVPQYYFMDALTNVLPEQEAAIRQSRPK